VCFWENSALTTRKSCKRRPLHPGGPPVADWLPALANHNGGAREFFSRASPDLQSPVGWSLRPSSRPWPGGGTPSSCHRSCSWGRIGFAGWSAHEAFVEPTENPCQRGRDSGWEESVAYWRDNQIPNQGISFCYCFLNTTWVSAGSNVQLRGN
jgi:hypothetical protein